MSFLIGTYPLIASVGEFSWFSPWVILEYGGERYEGFWNVVLEEVRKNGRGRLWLSGRSLVWGMFEQYNDGYAPGHKILDYSDTPGELLLTRSPRFATFNGTFMPGDSYQKMI